MMKCLVGGSGQQRVGSDRPTQLHGLDEHMPTSPRQPSVPCSEVRCTNGLRSFFRCRKGAKDWVAAFTR